MLRQVIRQILLERVSDIVFHKTSLNSALKIVSTNRIMTSVAFGTEADRMLNKEKLYYLSTMRSPLGEYYKGLPDVTLRMDGRRLSEQSKAAAVDYWGPTFPKDEMEDRVFTNKPYLEPASKYILDIHIGLPTKPEWDYRPWMLKAVQELMNGPIPAYIYPSEQSYKILNQTKRLSTFEEWEKLFSGQMTEPWDYESRPYVDSVLTGLAELITLLNSGDIESIPKDRNSEWYLIKYYGQSSGGIHGSHVSSVSSAIHNAKSKPEAREYIHIIGQEMRRLNVSSVKDLVNILSKRIDEETKKLEN